MSTNQHFWQVVLTILLAGLLTASQVSAQGSAVSPITQVISSSPINCEYTLYVAQNPANPQEFAIWAPNEMMTPVRLEAAVGVKLVSWAGRSIQFGGEAILGPFSWHPAITGWGTIVHFAQAPTVVVVGMMSWDNMARTYRLGCGCSLLPEGRAAEISYLPNIGK